MNSKTRSTPPGFCPGCEAEIMKSESGQLYCPENRIGGLHIPDGNRGFWLLYAPIPREVFLFVIDTVKKSMAPAILPAAGKAEQQTTHD